MKRLVLAIALLCAANLRAEPLKVASVQFSEKSSSVHYVDKVQLPFVSYHQPNVAKKINDYLYIDIARTIAPAKVSDGIKRHLSKDDDDPMAGVSSLDYKVLLNNGKLFTVQTEGESCGAYCEEFDNSYSFDVTTGRHITLQDLFTEDGLQSLRNKVYAARVATMQQAMKRLQKEAAKPKKKNQQKDEFEADLDETILLYETCITENAATHKDEVSSGDTHELAYFSIDAKGLTFTHERCSNHAMRGLDSIDEFHNHYTFQSLKPNLTTYAKHLLLNDTAKFDKPNDITGQVYYGSIGQAPITLLINNPVGYDTMLRAVYFYDKYRQPIELSGTGNNWTETNSTVKPQPSIKTTWQDDVSIGQWLGNGKTLPFKIAP